MPASESQPWKPSSQGCGVGAGEGAGVGAGAIVGVYVGLLEGVALGALVSEEVGAGVGAREGTCVVGAVVGEAVGEAVIISTAPTVIHSISKFPEHLVRTPSASSAAVKEALKLGSSIVRCIACAAMIDGTRIVSTTERPSALTSCRRWLDTINATASWSTARVAAAALRYASCLVSVNVSMVSS